MSPEELQHMKDTVLEEEESIQHKVCVCTAAGCLSRQGLEVKNEIEASIPEEKKKDIQVKAVGCMGLCSAGPLVSVETKGKDDVMYQNVPVEAASKVAASIDREPLAEYRSDLNQPFFKNQKKIVLENSGKIDPESLNDYVGAGGYEALMTAITEQFPREVVDTVTRSGLRGRGGGGYPTGLKWNLVAKAKNEKKYIICNADEGDPGAFMDRAVLESDPHRVIEGMAIAAFATGATHGYFYIRAEYPMAIERVNIALKQARKRGLLGSRIGGTDFSFDLEIRKGAGVFVCGEETALIASIEGKRGQPKPRPPYPGESGLWGCPTLINNVETFANIAPIIRNGWEWFANIGTQGSKGTKVFALAGKIKNTGLIEVPMGISIHEIVNEIGGGVPEGSTYKAIQTGGPSGGCIPKEYLEMPIDYESLKEVNSMMGSGGMIVLDETSNMVDVARFFMDFCRTESCGKCTPCRVGTFEMVTLLEKILEKDASINDLYQLEELCHMVRETSLCGLGQSAPNPILSTLKYFRNEYLSLLKNETELGEVAK